MEISRTTSPLPIASCREDPSPRVTPNILVWLVNAHWRRRPVCVSLPNYYLLSSIIVLFILRRRKCFLKKVDPQQHHKFAGTRGGGGEIYFQFLFGFYLAIPLVFSTNAHKHIYTREGERPQRSDMNSQGASSKRIGSSRCPTIRRHSWSYN